MRPYDRGSYKIKMPLFQRIISLLVWAAIAVAFIGVAILGIIFFWYALIVGVVLFVVAKVYTDFQTSKQSKSRAPSEEPCESGKVKRGNFRQGRGRTIDHE